MLDGVRDANAKRTPGRRAWTSGEIARRSAFVQPLGQTRTVGVEENDRLGGGRFLRHGRINVRISYDTLDGLIIFRRRYTLNARVTRTVV